MASCPTPLQVVSSNILSTLWLIQFTWQICCKFDIICRIFSKKQFQTRPTRISSPLIRYVESNSGGCMCPFSSVFWNDKQTMVAWSHISSDVQINPLGSQPLNFETVEEIIWQNEWLDNKMMIRSHTLVKTWYTSDKLTAITRKFWNFRNSCTDLTLDHKMILDSIVVIQEAYEINGAPQRSRSQQADKSDCWKLIEQRITWGVTYHRTIGRMVIGIVMITRIIR